VFIGGERSAESLEGLPLRATVSLTPTDFEVASCVESGSDSRVTMIGRLNCDCRRPNSPLVWGIIGVGETRTVRSDIVG
jgi:hypothetical protein